MSEEKKKIKTCLHSKEHACYFDGEPTTEDCMFCLPNSIIVTLAGVMVGIEDIQISLRKSWSIYTKLESIKSMSAGYFKMMKAAYPEVVERSRKAGTSLIAMMTERENPLPV